MKLRNMKKEPCCLTLQGGKTIHLGPFATIDIESKYEHDKEVKRGVEKERLRVIKTQATPKIIPQTKPLIKNKDKAKQGGK